MFRLYSLNRTFDQGFPFLLSYLRIYKRPLHTVARSIYFTGKFKNKIKYSLFWLRGTSGIDIDLRRVDIDQCSLPEGSTKLNIFASSNKCKNETTQVSLRKIIVKTVIYLNFFLYNILFNKTYNIFVRFKKL